MTTFQVVVAADDAWGIGRGGGLPWDLRGDMRRFRDLTTRTVDPAKTNAVIMGRGTWESLPRKPLAGRANVVLSRSAAAADFPEGVTVARDLGAALSAAAATGAETTFVIGGAAVYAEAMASPLLDAVHLTRVRLDAGCDTRVAPLDDARLRLVNSSPTYEEGGVRYAFLTYVSRRADDGCESTNMLYRSIKNFAAMFRVYFVNS